MPAGHFIKRPTVLICDPQVVTYAPLNWDASGFPPEQNWFALIEQAGSAVTGADLKKLETAAPSSRGSRNRVNKLPSLSPMQRSDVRRSQWMGPASSWISRSVDRGI